MIEIIVSLALFMTVVFIGTGAVLSIFDANRKSQSLRAVMDNLNSTLESMTRSIRFGYNYHCDINQGSISSPRDCGLNNSANSIVFTAPNGTRVVYKLSGNQIVRTIEGGPEYPMTSSDVTITSLAFRVFGSTSYSDGDLLQPQVIIVLRGYAGTKSSSQSTFSLETTVSQRIFDSQ